MLSVLWHCRLRYTAPRLPQSLKLVSLVQALNLQQLYPSVTGHVLLIPFMECWASKATCSSRGEKHQKAAKEPFEKEECCCSAILTTLGQGMEEGE